MGNVTRHSVFLIIDNETEDAKKCFDILKPFLREQGIEIATERFETSAEAGRKREGKNRDKRRDGAVGGHCSRLRASM